MADAGTKLTPQQKIEMARKALEDGNRGNVNPEGFAPNAVMRGSLVPEVRGRDAVVAALKKAPTMFEEFHREAHAILADNDQGQITEMWGMIEPEALKRIQGS